MGMQELLTTSRLSEQSLGKRVEQLQGEAQEEALANKERESSFQKRLDAQMSENLEGQRRAAEMKVSLQDCRNFTGCWVKLPPL